MHINACPRTIMKYVVLCVIFMLFGFYVALSFSVVTPAVNVHS